MYQEEHTNEEYVQQADVVESVFVAYRCTHNGFQVFRWQAGDELECTPGSVGAVPANHLTTVTYRHQPRGGCWNFIAAVRCDCH